MRVPLFWETTIWPGPNPIPVFSNPLPSCKKIGNQLLVHTTSTCHKPRPLTAEPTSGSDAARSKQLSKRPDSGLRCLRFRVWDLFGV